MCLCSLCHFSTSTARVDSSLVKNRTQSVSSSSETSVAPLRYASRLALLLETLISSVLKVPFSRTRVIFKLVPSLISLPHSHGATKKLLIKCWRKKILVIVPLPLIATRWMFSRKNWTRSVNVRTNATSRLRRSTPTVQTNVTMSRTCTSNTLALCQVKTELSVRLPDFLYLASVCSSTYLFTPRSSLSRVCRTTFT